MTTYRYLLPSGDEVSLRVDLADPSAAIQVEVYGEWCPTPYRSADAAGDDLMALGLVCRLLGGDYGGGELYATRLG